MTIAIGLLAADGVVVAADTQETVGTHKSDESKLLIANQGTEKQKAGAIVVTGAGDATYLDDISFEICHAFLRKKKWTPIDLRAKVKHHVNKLHSESIVPFAKFPDYDRPGFRLVVAAQVGERPALWYTDKGAVAIAKKYCAVGIGCPQALAMLRRFWTPMDTIRAASLAAYIVFHVKNSTEGCGNETQIVIIKDRYAAYLSQDNINLLEYAFDERARFENQFLHFNLGISDNPEEDIKDTLTRFSAYLYKSRKDITDAQRFVMTSYHRGKRPVDQPQMVRPTQSAAQNSEGQQ